MFNSELKKRVKLLENRLDSLVGDLNLIQVVRGLGPFKTFSPSMTKSFEIKSKSGGITIYVDLWNKYLEVRESKLRDILEVRNVTRVYNELELIGRGL